ncbi:MAG: hypothetical protein R8K50_07335 [Mariprofundus sp.]
MDMLNANALIPWRASERLLIVAVGALCIYLGYRLFWSMREFKSNGEGNIDLPGGISIHLSRVGPGVFFALFGALIIGTSIVTPLNMKLNTPVTSTTPAAESAPPVASASLSYATDRADVTVTDQDRAAVLRDLDALTIMQPALQDVLDGKALSINKTDATRLIIALPHIRRTMLLSVWNQQQWGKISAFDTWLDGGYDTPPPADIRIPATLFLGRDAKAQ